MITIIIALSFFLLNAISFVVLVGIREEFSLKESFALAFFAIVVPFWLTKIIGAIKDKHGLNKESESEE